MKPLAVTAIFGAPSAAKNELVAHLLSHRQKCTSIRFTEGSDLHRISPVLDRIASAAGENAWDHAVLEMDDRTNPQMLAEGFACAEAHGLSFSEVAYLASVVTVVDTTAFLRSIRPDGPPAEFPQGFRNDLVEQLEVSDFIIMPRTENPADWEQARAIMLTLNPRAAVVAAPATTELLGEMLDGRHDGRTAQMNTGWQRRLEGDDSFQPPAEELSIFLYEARRPFHPQRLWNLFRAPVPGVFRAKGYFWLATRMSQLLGLAKAGSEVRFGMVGQWWASVDRSQWPPIPDLRANIEKRWQEPYGDRQQAIVLMGMHADYAQLCRSLDACLLNDAEMESGVSAWSALDDPFPAWHAHSHDDHHHDHHHEHEPHADHTH